MSTPLIDGLQAVLAAHHGAIYGYPVIGVQLADDGQIEQAHELEAQHRLARDSVTDQLQAAGATPVASAASYSPPAPVTDAASACAWAVQLEQQTAEAYRFLLLSCIRAGGSQAATRRQALSGLSTAAGSATYWRAALTPDSPTIAFPGASE
jgi:hypothetical protein